MYICAHMSHYTILYTVIVTNMTMSIVNTKVLIVDATERATCVMHGPGSAAHQHVQLPGKCG